MRSGRGLIVGCGEGRGGRERGQPCVSTDNELISIRFGRNRVGRFTLSSKFVPPSFLLDKSIGFFDPRTDQVRFERKWMLSRREERRMESFDGTIPSFRQEK